MDLERLLKKSEEFQRGKHKIDTITMSSFEQDFELTYTHNSTAIEGNTLTLMETKVVLEDGISVGGKELREIYEVAVHGDLTKFTELIADLEEKQLDSYIRCLENRTE